MGMGKLRHGGAGMRGYRGAPGGAWGGRGHPRVHSVGLSGCHRCPRLASARRGLLSSSRGLCFLPAARHAFEVTSVLGTVTGKRGSPGWCGDAVAPRLLTPHPHGSQ